MESKIVSFLKRLLITGEFGHDLRKEALELLLEQPASERQDDCLAIEIEAGTVKIPTKIIDEMIEVTTREIDGGKIAGIKLLRDKTGLPLKDALEVHVALFPVPLDRAKKNLKQCPEVQAKQDFRYITEDKQKETVTNVKNTWRAPQKKKQK